MGKPAGPPDANDVLPPSSTDEPDRQDPAYSPFASAAAGQDSPFGSSPGSPCLVCGRQPCDAHHLRFAQSRGLGLKVSDEFTVLLCRAHHRELHQSGKEVDWWARMGIEPIDIALKLWTTTRPLLLDAAGPAPSKARRWQKRGFESLEANSRSER